MILRVYLHTLCASFLFVSSCLADWKNHLNFCLDKKENHSIIGVDFIYMINLKDRPDKWEISMNQLAPYGIKPYRFEAINGWTLSNEAKQDLGFSKLPYWIRDGRLGCLLSHLSVLTDAYNSGYETIWVMEDDICVVRNPLLISNLIRHLDQLQKDWDILYTDVESKDANGEYLYPRAVFPRPNVIQKSVESYNCYQKINNLFVEVGMRYGCYSMIIRRSGIEKILSYFNEHGFFYPLDNELCHVPNLKQVTLTKEFITHQYIKNSNTTYKPVNQSN